MKKRGQITIFILLGLLTVSAVLLLIYFMIPQTPEINLFSEELKNELQLNIQSCLKLSFDQALIGLAGTAGKNIDDLIEERDFVVFNDKKIVYAVSLNPEFTQSIDDFVVSNKKIPDYPWTTFPFFEGGEVLTAPLFGWNTLITKNELKINIEKKTRELFDSCINTLDKKEFIKTLPKPELTSLSSVKIDAIKLKKAEAETTIKPISIKTSIDIKKIHDFANELINQEITDLEFSPKSTLDFLVTNEKDDLLNNIIIIADRNNKELFFIFGIPNRIPALSYINTDFFKESDDNLLCRNSIVEFDIVNKK